MRFLISLLCAALVSLAAARADTIRNRTDGLVTLGTRTFDLRKRTPIQDLQVENEFVSLSDVDWIWDLTQADPHLQNTVIHIKDQTALHAGVEPTWAPDAASRFHPDPTLPPLFDLDGYKVGWQGLHEAPARGDVLIFPEFDSKRFYARCGFDRAEPKPIFCAVSFRYIPDRNLLVTTRIYQVTAPLNNFAEIAARVEALVRCLDVTEALRAGEKIPAIPDLVPADLAAGGRCRAMPSS
ncbi:hypothetical protein [Defluviimonas salinarum]|uniref:Methanolan biosynthesis EpsI domain-containing protein n=1 Tax=Defluviimonas salinarum TaxID=2992147 RepID=A0ABT3IZ56_9RHOB|nr:hypothetical protein [Defluviimonas salinarum]MCW3780716.1 hypothetical protein [Defluviimonas salinarum]